ncbi:MAG: aldoketomutase [Candidatus Diapherotrites archaeon]|uniref:Bleomycin resistance protein n=1 Tax=Candidatus Iainarchaeum sp. TaxID=3101447 RepID=A0A2D6LZV2_9ARCH|nr:aldoketomutase [Candidatus Diapherotrites archaeon]
MKFNKLIPELSVSDINKSLEFYTKILGFKVEYERPEKKFAFLSLGEAQIMIDGNSNGGQEFKTGKLEKPFGRGIHFQIELKKIEPVLESIKKSGWPLKSSPKEYWFRKDKELIGMKGFLVQDLDGYLLMFNQHIGNKPVK